jgi:hypothetical protein
MAMSPFRKILSTTTMLSYTFKVIAAFMVHLLLFCLDGRTIQIEQYLPLHLGEQLCKILHPGLIIDGETAYDVDILDSWLFWGLLLLPLYFFLWGRNVTIGYLLVISIVTLLFSILIVPHPICIF